MKFGVNIFPNYTTTHTITGNKMFKIIIQVQNLQQQNLLIRHDINGFMYFCNCLKYIIWRI